MFIIHSATSYFNACVATCDFRFALVYSTASKTLADKNSFSISGNIGNVYMKRQGDFEQHGPVA